MLLYITLQWNPSELDSLYQNHLYTKHGPKSILHYNHFKGGHYVCSQDVRLRAASLKHVETLVTINHTYLFKLKDMLVKVVLEMFVSIVDTELFKAVPPEVFKTKDVQHTYGITLKNDNKKYMNIEVYKVIKQ